MIRAARIARREDGGFAILAYEEGPEAEPAPEALVSFLRKHGIHRHPVVVAIASPTAHVTHATLPPDIIGQSESDVRIELLEHLHPEPEQVDVRTRPLSSDTFIVVMEERPRVEAYLVTLERANVAAYALASSLASVFALLRDNGLLNGDGIFVRVGARWTDLLFFDEYRIRHLGLPLTSREVEAEGGADRLAEDIRRLLGFHRSRVPTDAVSERILVLGTKPETAARVAEALPAEAIGFPGGPPLFSGKGRLKDDRVAEILRAAPGAVGAAIAGAASPRRLDLAFRALPNELRAPGSPAGVWIAASLILVAALLVAWLGANRGRDEIMAAADRLEQASRGPSRDAVTRLEVLNGQARRTLALPRAVERLLATLPPESAAPYRTTLVELEVRPDGGYDGTLDLALPASGSAEMAPRFLDWLRAAREQFPDGLVFEPGRDGSPSTVRFRWSTPGGGR